MIGLVVNTIVDGIKYAARLTTEVVANITRVKAVITFDDQHAFAQLKAKNDELIAQSKITLAIQREWQASMLLDPQNTPGWDEYLAKADRSQYEPVGRGTSLPAVIEVGGKTYDAYVSSMADGVMEVRVKQTEEGRKQTAENIRKDRKETVIIARSL